jgi:hypothetical protein
LDVEGKRRVVKCREKADDLFSLLGRCFLVQIYITYVTKKMFIYNIYFNSFIQKTYN